MEQKSESRITWSVAFRRIKIPQFNIKTLKRQVFCSACWMSCHCMSTSRIRTRSSLRSLFDESKSSILYIKRFKDLHVWGSTRMVRKLPWRGLGFTVLHNIIAQSYMQNYDDLITWRGAACGSFVTNPNPCSWCQPMYKTSVSNFRTLFLRATLT